ncbi:MAG: hypothetical protein ACKV22_20870 [Bryobacteraceae bacterium]
MRLRVWSHLLFRYRRPGGLRDHPADAFPLGSGGGMGSRDAYDDLTGVSMYFTTEAKGERGTMSIQHFPHVRNFLDCVKSRQKPVRDIEIGHRSTTACHLANISYRTGERIEWDGAAERITNSARANALLTVKYRDPWMLSGL